LCHVIFLFLKYTLGNYSGLQPGSGGDLAPVFVTDWRQIRRALLIFGVSCITKTSRLRCPHCVPVASGVMYVIYQQVRQARPGSRMKEERIGRQSPVAGRRHLPEMQGKTSACSRTDNRLISTRILVLQRGVTVVTSDGKQACTPLRALSGWELQCGAGRH